jgi:hypothetical protein
MTKEAVKEMWKIFSLTAAAAAAEKRIDAHVSLRNL